MLRTPQDGSGPSARKRSHTPRLVQQRLHVRSEGLADPEPVEAAAFQQRHRPARGGQPQGVGGPGGPTADDHDVVRRGHRQRVLAPVAPAVGQALPGLLDVEPEPAQQLHQLVVDHPVLQQAGQHLAQGVVDA